MTKILLLQGPNLNWLGRREVDKYGTTTLEDLHASLRRHAGARSYELDVFQTNVEGLAIDRVYAATEDGTDVLVANPAGMTYAGYAFRDCIRAVKPVLPYIEVHILHLDHRGTASVPGTAADGVVHGFGVRGYLLALEAALMTAGHAGWYDVAALPPKIG
jgi:3-dehydroquinate dehydratase II